MKKWAIIGGIIAVVVLAVIIVLLYLGGMGPPTVRLRDISIIFISLFAVIATILLAAIVGAILWLVLLLRDRVVPLLETLTEIAQRARGTTDFVTEQAVSPIIQAAGTFARIRAATKTATGGKPRPVPRQRETD
jgi:Flp pilus assembly protein protease CpaA